MAYHDWSEKDFDWKGLNAAGEDITSFCKRWARLGGQSKEKFGEFRFYASFGLSLHYLFLPGYYNYGWMPRWLITFDQRVFSPLCNKLLIDALWRKYQQLIYCIAYRRALKNFPTLREEIAGGADAPELFAHFIGRERVKEDDGYKIVNRYYYKDGTFLCGWSHYEKAN